MKKILSLTLCAVLLAGCTAASTKKTAATATPTPTPTPSATASAASDDDNIASPFELRTKTLDMSGYQFLTDTDPAFLQVTMEESLRLITQAGTGIIIYSYPACPYCNRAVPILNEAAKEMGVKIYYVNVFEKELLNSDGKSFSTTGKALINLMLKDYDSIVTHTTNTTTGALEPELLTPEVVAIKDGKIVGHHTSLLDGVSIKSASDQLTDDQKKQLKQIYEDLIKAVQA